MACGSLHSSTSTGWGHLQQAYAPPDFFDSDPFEDDISTGTQTQDQSTHLFGCEEDNFDIRSTIRSIEAGPVWSALGDPFIVDRLGHDSMAISHIEEEASPLRNRLDMSAVHEVSGDNPHVHPASPVSVTQGAIDDSLRSKSISSSRAVQPARRHAKIEGHYKCTFPRCKVAKDRNSDLAKHIRNVHADKMHICVQCQKGFAQEKDLRRHLPTHGRTPASSDLSDDLSSSSRALSPTSIHSPGQKRADYHAAEGEQSNNTRQRRPALHLVRQALPLEGAAATLNAEVNVISERDSRLRNVSHSSCAASSADKSQYISFQHLEDLRCQYDRRLSKQIDPSIEVRLPQELEFGAVCNDTIIVTSRNLLTTFCTRYNSNSQIKLRMPAGPRREQRKLLDAMKQILSNCAARSTTRILFIGIDPKTGSTAVIEANRSSVLLRKLVESCGSADTEERASDAWDPLNNFLQSILDEDQSEFAETCKVCWA